MSKKNNVERTDSLKSNNMSDFGVTRLKTYEENNSEAVVLRKGYLDKKVLGCIIIKEKLF